MTYHTAPPPPDVLRGLLGIARAVYAARKTHGAPVEELDELVDAGALFVAALDGSGTRPNTLGHQAAWAKAEKATATLLGTLASDDDSLASLALACSERLRRAG